MKKLLLSLITFVCFVAFGLGIYSNLKTTPISDLTRQNIEVLARGHGGDGSLKVKEATLTYKGTILVTFDGGNKLYECGLYNVSCSGDGPIPCEPGDYISGCEHVGYVV